MNTLVTLFFATLMLSPTTWAAINPDDILKGQTNCPQLATSTQSKETILEFARRGSKIEICSSTPQIAQEDLMSLSIQDRKNITLFVNNKTYDLNALQNLTTSGVNIQISAQLMKQSGLEFDTLQYLAQVPTAGKVRIFVDSKEALDMDQLALLSSRHIDMHLKLEKSAVETKSDLDRLSQVMRGRLTVYTDGSTLPESELAQARSYGTIFKLQN